MPPLDVIIVAGGAGSRFGARKQFARLAGVPIVRRAASCFEPVPDVTRIIVVVPAEDMDMAETLFEDAAKEVIVAPGGATRQESVLSGLRHANPSGTVLVHDGARPLAPAELIHRVIAGLEGAEGCIPCLSLTDTLKEVRGGFVARTVPRDSLFCAQTPQAFLTDALAEAHLKAAARGDASRTDDSALMEDAGMRVRVVEGDPLNVKITRPEDLVLAEAVLRCRTGWA
jgi:2-C-methyl-D-erythritol 4-phosphate cytidylyltransferase